MRATALGILTACFQPVDACWEKKHHHADHPTAHSHRSQAGGQEVEVAGTARFAAAAGRLRARFYDHAKEAELRTAEGRARAAYDRYRSHCLHPWHWAQPPGALGRAHTRRPREGPAGRPLSHHSWNA